MKIILRVLGNAGGYPSRNFISDDHILFVREDIVWSAVRQPPSSYLEDMELAWLWPEEIRLYAAVTLLEPHPELYGRYFVQPWTTGANVGSEEWANGFGSEVFLREATNRALEFAASARISKFFLPQRDQPYELYERGEFEEITELISAIDPDDELLLRGLSKLLSANHLIRYREFIEEAGLMAYISMEAALEFIRQYLELETGLQKSFKDVFEHIRVTFPTGEPFAGVLEMDYENRIIMVHPANRFGEYWTPPVYAGECFEAMYSIIHLYRYVLLGEIWDPNAADPRHA